MLFYLQAIETKLKTYREQGPVMQPRQWQQTHSCCTATQYTLLNPEVDEIYDVKNTDKEDDNGDILQQATTNLIAAATIAPLTTI